jgi:putative membrane protein
VRLHPFSVPYRSANAIVRLAWALVFFVFFGVGTDSAGFGPLIVAVVVLGALGVALAWEFAYYQRYDYELTADTFDIRSGVVSRRTREIPLRRIQNVDIQRNVVQRALGIAEVSLETAGGSETEANLRFVASEEAERIRREVGRLKRGAEPEAVEPEVATVFSITDRELLLLGVISVDLRLLGLFWVLLPIVSPILSLPTSNDGVVDPVIGFALAAPVLAFGLVVLAALVSVVRAITSYFGFRLDRASDELQYERGLLQQFSGTIPLEKVQTLAIEENVIARRLGYASLTVETAGYAPGESGSQSAVPIAERDHVSALARSIEPFGEVTFERPPKRARIRYVVRYSALVLVLTGVAYLVSRYTALTLAWYLGVLALPLAVLAAHLKWRNLGYALLDDYFVTRQGFWTRRTTVVPYYRVQTVIESATPFQRRRRLATVVADTAGSRSLTGVDAKALDIDAAAATTLREALEARLQGALVEHRRARQARSVGDATGA